MSSTLGNGNGFSVKEVIATALRITGCDITCVESERRARRSTGSDRQLGSDEKQA